MSMDTVIDALPKEIKDAIIGLKKLHSTPDELALPLVLGVANFAAQGLADVDSGLWKPNPISCMFVVLSESGSRKSQAMNEVIAGIKDFEREQRSRYGNEIDMHRAELKQYKRDLEAFAKDPTKQPPTMPEPIIGKKFILQKTTTNGLIDALEAVPVCGLMNPDAGEFFHSYVFQDRKASKDTEFVAVASKAWSGEDIDRQTGIEENNKSVDSRRFSMTALLQEELAGFLDDDQYRNQGFTHRLLISKAPPQFVPTAKIEKVDPTKKRTQDIVREKYLDPFNDRVFDMLTKVVPNSHALKQKIKHGTADHPLRRQIDLFLEDPRMLVLPAMQLDDEAVDIFNEFNAENDRIIHRGETGKFTNFYRRRYEHTLRLAATLAVFDGNDTIGETHAVAAWALIEWFTDQRINLEVNVHKVDPCVAMAEELAQYMREQKLQRATVRQLYTARRAFGGMAANKRKTVIEELENLGLADIETKGTSVIVHLKEEADDTDDDYPKSKS